MKDLGESLLNNISGQVSKKKQPGILPESLITCGIFVPHADPARVARISLGLDVTLDIYKMLLDYKGGKLRLKFCRGALFGKAYSTTAQWMQVEL